DRQRVQVTFVGGQSGDTDGVLVDAQLGEVFVRDLLEQCVFRGRGHRGERGAHGVQSGLVTKFQDTQRLVDGGTPAADVPVGLLVFEDGHQEEYVSGARGEDDAAVPLGDA